VSEQPSSGMPREWLEQRIIELQRRIKELETRVEILENNLEILRKLTPGI
jgi:predicted RNase H-like nuclease (RuvC/YqgF family)